MPNRKRTERGFTLIEVIVTLVLVGITAALAGMWIVSVANGYIFAKQNASTTQKAQLALTRLTKEFAAIKSVSTGSSNSITYVRTDSSFGDVIVKAELPSGSKALGLTITAVGGPYTLTDNVSSFILRYCTNDSFSSATCPGPAWIPNNSGATEPSSIIEIELTLTDANSTPITFIKRVSPRNL